jgi:pimeloyl-ACP methyl ester carboxylesterase
LLSSLAGCAQDLTGPRAIYLDGAGWYGGDKPVRAGLRQAGFQGPVDRYNWASLLGPVHDHVWANKDHPKAAALSRRIARLRQADAKSPLILLGLSAGSSIIVSALEQLPQGVQVDHVVLLSPSVSARHDLAEALRHVKHRLYATYSPYDTVLATAPSAGLEGGRPAGQVGFSQPADLAPAKQELYRKVVNLRWRPGHAAYGWDGGHVSVTSADFISAVIAPRILSDAPHPLDRPPRPAEGTRDE